jgi:hypothetical protein
MAAVTLGARRRLERAMVMVAWIMAATTAPSLTDGNLKGVKTTWEAF